MYIHLFLWCFLWLKIGFLFGVTVYAFISMVLFMVKIGFLFGVNVYAFISMVLFYC